MAKVEREHEFDGSVDKVFAGIRQYDKYPEYLPGVTKIEILPAAEKGSSCQVRYELNIIKKFYYTLNMYEDSPSRIWWTLAESNLMKHNNGSWDLEEDGDQTQASYSLDVKFKGLVPSAVTDKVAKSSLPAMFAGFQKLIDENA